MTTESFSKLSFPAEYSSKNYLIQNPDLRDVDIQKHWKEFGRFEQRSGQFILDRNQLLKYLPSKLRYFEIGPFGRPFIKRDKFNVKYFDVIDQAALIEKTATADGHEPQSVPYIDYVDAKGRLININEKFDVAFSSHCIEHQPNIIRHLNEVAQLLENDGVYICVIPDFRFCFDHFKPATTILDILEAYVEGHDLHSPKKLLMNEFMVTHNDPVQHWSGMHGNHKLHNLNIDYAISKLSKESEAYEDCHAWFFTPQTFRSIFYSEIAKYTGLRLDLCYETPSSSHEFIAIFRKELG